MICRQSCRCRSTGASSQPSSATWKWKWEEFESARAGAGNYPDDGDTTNDQVISPAPTNWPSRGTTKSRLRLSTRNCISWLHESVCLSDLEHERHYTLSNSASYTMPACRRASSIHSRTRNVSWRPMTSPAAPRSLDMIVWAITSA